MLDDRDRIDEPARGTKTGVVGVKTFRPFPRDDVRMMLWRGRTRRRAGEGRVIGVGGIVGQNIRLSLEGLPVKVYDVIAGLGGRRS